MKAVILCGGQGTRIRGVDDDVPKPMLRIGGLPIVWHIMSSYAQHGISDFVLCLGYKGWLIKEFFVNLEAFLSDVEITFGETRQVKLLQDRGIEMPPWRVLLAETGEETNTAGRLAAVQPYLADDDLFCLTYGDGVADLDIAEVVRHHRTHGKIATVTGVRPPGRFGVMSVRRSDHACVVDHFEEKPRAEQGWINGGFFVFDRRVWDYISEDAQVMLEHQPLEELAAAGELVMYPHEGFWQCMDTYRDWRELNQMWSGGVAPWRR